MSDREHDGPCGECLPHGDTSLQTFELEAWARGRNLAIGYTSQLRAVFEARDRFRAALESIARQCVCRCEESWTSRGRHSPDCVGHIGDEARDALKGPTT